METLFNLSNLFIMPFWLMMILLPHWRWTQRIMATLWPIVPLAAVYAFMLLTQLGEGAAESLLNPTMAGIAALLGTPAGAAVGWIHFLAFDLFVGRWAYLDSRQRQISAWLVSPTLFFVLMAGPLGLLLYLAVRWGEGQVKNRR
ncbi:MAG: ABA4-like family protein [Chloroflexi bacterium]|nr:ABA4-like family protein [Chloroflexota bacterium]